jgi:hypothetical protein
LFRLALASGLVALGGIAACGGGPAPAEALYVRSTGSDDNACTSSAPCASFAHAYRVAKPGQVVEIADGVYPAQRIDRDLTKSSGDDVVFRPAQGATVTVGGSLSLGSVGDEVEGAEHVTFENMAITGTIAAYDASDFVWENIDAKNFYLNSVRDVVIRGGDYGPCMSSVEPCSNSKIDKAGGSQRNANILIEGAAFHDYRVGKPGDHFECLFVRGGTNITLRGNKFWNCDFYDVFVQHAGERIAGLQIENNWFDKPWNGNPEDPRRDRATGIEFSPRGVPFEDVLIRYNSFFATGISVNGDGDGTVYSNFRILANVLTSYWGSCYPSVAFQYNVWLGGTACDDSDRSVPGARHAYVSPVHGAEGDYRLTGGVAVDLVPDASPDLALDRDIDGRRRPLGRARDAGSHELA